MRLYAMLAASCSVLVLAGAVWAGTVGACTAPPLAQGTVESRVEEATAPRIELGPGDRISVVVFLHPESSTPAEGAVIDVEGKLDIPLLGPVVRAGLSPDEARELLTEALAHYLREPQVAVNVLQLASRRVYVFGEIERPGPYPLDRPLTALQALSLAGGFRPGADRAKVALLRGTRDELQG